MTAICPNCGKPVRPGARFCGNCRADLSAAGQTCPYCRAPISPAAQSCPKCGKALPAGLSSPPTPASGSITLPALTPSRQTGAAPTQRVSPPASIPTTPIETSPPRKSAGPLAITGALVLSLCCLASLIGGFVFREQLPFFGVTSTPPALPSLPTLVPSLTASATLTASALPPTATPTLKPTRTSTFTPSPTLTPLITPTLTLSPTQPADVPSLTPPAFIPAPNDIISETFDAQWQEQWSFGVNVLPMPGENPSLQLAGDPKKAWIVSRTDVPLTADAGREPLASACRRPQKGLDRVSYRCPLERGLVHLFHRRSTGCQPYPHVGFRLAVCSVRCWPR